MKITPHLLAQRFIGIQEVPGAGDNHQILAMLKLDDSWPEHDEVPWCSAYVNYICWLLRLPRSKRLNARSWLDVGQEVGLEGARVGWDVVVLSRPPNDESGHVGFYSGHNAENIYLLGGNQGDSVNVRPFSRTRLLGVRRLGDEMANEVSA
jgi:uncharacterized protein (TIGR02594 family)